MEDQQMRKEVLVLQSDHRAGIPSWQDPGKYSEMSTGGTGMSQKLIIVDSCQDCPKGTYMQYGPSGGEIELAPFCKLLDKHIGKPGERLLQKDTHPECKLEDARGFL